VIIWHWLKWVFSISGIQYTTREPYAIKVFGRRLFWIARHVGVGYLPHGPNAVELTVWSVMEKRFHRKFRACTCKLCGTTVWAYKPVKVCESFKCFHKNGGKWS